MAEKTADEWLGTWVQARYAHGQGVHVEGKVVAYCPVPSVLIEDADGKQTWWRADLTEAPDA